MSGTQKGKAGVWSIRTGSLCLLSMILAGPGGWLPEGFCPCKQIRQLVQCQSTFITQNEAEAAVLHSRVGGLGWQALCEWHQNLSCCSRLLCPPVPSKDWGRQLHLEPVLEGKARQSIFKWSGEVKVPPVASKTANPSCHCPHHSLCS